MIKYNGFLGVYVFVSYVFLVIFADSISSNFASCVASNIADSDILPAYIVTNIHPGPICRAQGKRLVN